MIPSPTCPVHEAGGSLTALPSLTFDEIFSWATPVVLLRRTARSGRRLRRHPEFIGHHRFTGSLGRGRNLSPQQLSVQAEASQADGATFHDKVYKTRRPELVFKATPSRMVGPGCQT